MGRCKVALFGEAERGAVGTPLTMHSLSELNEKLGHPPSDSQGLLFAIQFLLFEQEVIYVRVQEKEFSTRDYLNGIKDFEAKVDTSNLIAFCLPGVGDARIFHAVDPILSAYEALMITTQKDLYDYMTSLPRKQERFQ